jgi:hypothetical protein
MHQSIGNTLRVIQSMENPPDGIVRGRDMVDAAIANAMYVTRCTYHSTLQTTPGGLAFGRADMILNIPLATDLELLRERRQQLINKRLVLANAKRFSYDYKVGDEVLKLAFNPSKLAPRATGPFTIERVHAANGTVTVRIKPGTIQRLSLRQIKPYHW